ncbi:MAG: hypothetical protein VXX55_13030, partial [Planctomycetota bacterium]|nr:hypothetical protein [Planctomycetota bacterium]
SQAREVVISIDQWQQIQEGGEIQPPTESEPEKPKRTNKIKVLEEQVAEEPTEVTPAAERDHLSPTEATQRFQYELEDEEEVEEEELAEVQLEEDCDEEEEGYEEDHYEEDEDLIEVEEEDDDDDDEEEEEEEEEAVDNRLRPSRN